MKKVILTKGLPGCGKTTWTLALIDESPNTYKRINKDDLRAMFDHSHFSKDSEKFVLRIRDMLILATLENGKHVIVDDTNLAPKHEINIRALVKGLATVEIQDFTDTDIDICIARDLKRCNSVGAKVIRQMYNQFIAKQSAPIQFDPALPTAVICDLDGTLCLMNGRNPYDASECQNDLLSPVVANLIKDRTVILVSGREEKYLPPTLEFLSKHNIKYEKLFMRQTDDKRKDWIIKNEIWHDHIAGKYNIEFVLDDRNRVVEGWRSLGLTVLQVADGDF